jgi:hypothetical protein
MSTTDSFEPVAVPPVGAIPQPPPGGGFVDGIEPSEPLRLLSRSGDTAVVFRLERRLPFLHRLAEQAAQRLDRLLDYRGILIAGGVVLLAVGALALTMGGAYRKPPSHHETPAAAASPLVVPLVAPPVPATVEVPAPPPEVRHAAPAAKPAAVHRTGAHAKKPHAANRHAR